jgi:hypothetical protein
MRARDSTDPIRPVENVLIIEDERETGRLLRSYLDDQLIRLVTVPEPLRTPKNPRTGYSFRDAKAEPGQGQLRHLAQGPIFTSTERGRRDVASVDLPKVELFPLGDPLAALVTAARAVPITVGTVPEDPSAYLVNRVVEMVDGFFAPDVLIVDLAIGEDEGADMVKAKGDVPFVEEEDTDLLDPRPELRKLSGFKLMRIYGLGVEIPVIVTSYLRNPLVAHHCLVNGAFAFVRKPLHGMTAGQDVRNDPREPDWRALDDTAKEGSDGRAVVIQRYLTDVSAEVLKAMTALQLSNFVPVDRRDEAG